MERNDPTLSETMRHLKSQGYTEDFNLKSDCIECPDQRLKISPSDFQIDQFFRFEGPTDPSDSAILYAISSKQHNVKGVLVNAYGVYADTLTNEMIEKLKTH